MPEVLRDHTGAGGKTCHRLQHRCWYSRRCRGSGSRVCDPVRRKQLVAPQRDACWEQRCGPRYGFAQPSFFYLFSRQLTGRCETDTCASKLNFRGKWGAYFSNKKAVFPPSPNFTAETVRWRKASGGVNCGSRAPPRGTPAPAASAGLQNLFFLFFHLFSFYFFPQESHR